MRRAAAQAAAPKRTAAEILKKQARAAQATAGRGDAECPPGQTLRAAYLAASGKPVPAKCVPARGAGRPFVDAQGRKVVVPLRKGRLAQYGYLDVTAMSLAGRRAALRRAMAAERDWLSLFRRLVYTATLTKTTDPERSAVFRADADWLKATFAPRASAAKK